MISQMVLSFRLELFLVITSQKRCESAFLAPTAEKSLYVVCREDMRKERRRKERDDDKCEVRA